MAIIAALAVIFSPAITTASAFSIRRICFYGGNYGPDAPVKVQHHSLTAMFALAVDFTRFLSAVARYRFYYYYG